MELKKLALYSERKDSSIQPPTLESPECELCLKMVNLSSKFMLSILYFRQHYLSVASYLGNTGSCKKAFSVLFLT